MRIWILITEGETRRSERYDFQQVSANGQVKNFYTGIPKQVTTSFLEACPKCDIVTLVVDLPKEPEYDPADPGALDRWRAANAKNVER